MNKIKLHYDAEGDILDIFFGKPAKAISEEKGDDILVRKDPHTEKILGYTILNFLKRSKKEEKGFEFSLPIIATVSKKQ